MFRRILHRRSVYELEDELIELRNQIVERDRLIRQLQDDFMREKARCARLCAELQSATNVLSEWLAEEGKEDVSQFCD